MVFFTHRTLEGRENTIELNSKILELNSNTLQKDKEVEEIN